MQATQICPDCRGSRGAHLSPLRWLVEIGRDPKHPEFGIVIVHLLG
jgi:hypothetical protein